MIRKATESDLPAVLAILRDTRAEMASYGNDQWNDDYPQAADFLADIRAGLKLGNPATPFAEIPDRRQAIYYALAHAQPGDIVAILGKGHETTIERNGVKEPFVESEIVEEYWDSKRAVLR